MNADFPRILTLLRKEKGISQKQAAEQLEVSQALLSHYEKGIRECGLDFLIRAASFYGVSCDYLLGRSAERSGAVISIDDMAPDVEDTKPNSRNLSAMLNKKLLSNSLNILYDYLVKSDNQMLVREVSSFLSLAVYRMFRVIHRAGRDNNDEMFGVPKSMASAQAGARMRIAEATAAAIADGNCPKQLEPLKNPQDLNLSVNMLSDEYPQAAPPLLNLLRNCENQIKIEYTTK